MRRPWEHAFDVLTHILILLPLILTIWDFTQGRLGANPIREIQLRTGRTTLTLLVLCLAVTPVFTIFGIRQALVLRRRLGLYAFMYAGLHFLNFVGVDYGFNLSLIREDIFEKRYAVIGFIAFLLLIPLAITSMKGWRQRLGKTWKWLHRLVYAAAILGVVHLYWSLKADKRLALIYGVVVIVLLITRIPPVRNALTKCFPRFKQAA